MLQARPISLATTLGISVDFCSSRYLDVSVREVRSLWPMYSARSDPYRAGFPHSEICGSRLICQLPAAFRRLTRLSSPVIAKASTTCTYSLDPITLSTACGKAFTSPLAMMVIGHSRLRHRIRLRMRHYRYNQTHVLARRNSPSNPYCRFDGSCALPRPLLLPFC